MPPNLLTLLGCFSLISSISHAAFKIKPGLWEVQTTTTVDGKTVDASKKLSESLQKMSPAQRKEMEKMMGGQGLNFSENGVKICHTEMSMDESMIRDPQHHCEIKNRKNLANGIKFDIHCKNGKGTAEYHRKSDKAYTGFNEFQTEKGKSRTDFKGKFISADCGAVKPLQMVK